MLEQKILGWKNWNQGQQQNMKWKNCTSRKMWNVWKPQFNIFLAFTMRSKLSRVSCSLSPMSPVYYGFMLKRAALKISQDFARRMRHHHDGLSTRSKITGLESKFFPISPTLITKVFGVKLNWTKAICRARNVWKLLKMSHLSFSNTVLKEDLES